MPSTVQMMSIWNLKKASIVSLDIVSWGQAVKIPPKNGIIRVKISQMLVKMVKMCIFYIILTSYVKIKVR